MKKFALLFALLLASSFEPLVQAQPAPSQSKATQAGGGQWPANGSTPATDSKVKDTPSTIDPGDTLTVTVFNQPTYSGDFLVLEDGTVNGRGFGRVLVAHKTVAEVQSKIHTILLKTLKNPEVTVVFKNQLNSPVYVIGSLHSGGQLGGAPGMTPWVPFQTLREFIVAQGIPMDPDLIDAYLYHRGVATPLLINLPKLLRGDPSVYNGQMQPYDELVMLPRAYIRVFFNTNIFAGQTEKTGEVRIKAGDDVYRGLAEAGGITNTSGFLLEELSVVVKRGGQVFKFPAKQDPKSPTFLLLDGDYIYIDGPTQIHVTVSGEVVQPGYFAVNAGGPVSAAIAQAKGLMTDASLHYIDILRGADAYQVDAAGPTAGAPEAPFTLQNNDVIFVRRSQRDVYVLGQVKNPGRYLIPDELTWTAKDGLAAAGGLAQQGTMRRVILVRAVNGKYTKFQFNIDEFLKDAHTKADPVLQPGDILLFGEPKGISTTNLGEIVSGALIISAFKG